LFLLSGAHKLKKNHDSSAAKMDLPACVVMCTVTPASSNHNPTAAITFCCSLFTQVLNKFQDIFHLSSGNTYQQNGNCG
jgi:hypothetical protein